jgi:hypothetical protein
MKSLKLPQFWFLMATNCRVLARRMNGGGSQTSEESFVSVCLVCYVSTDNIFEVSLVFITECDLVYEDTVKTVSFSKYDGHKIQCNKVLLRTLT